MPRRRVQTFPVRLTEFVNVRDWGAKGDNSTDDTTAFQSAINALRSTGGVIIVPEGLSGADDYNVTGGSLSVGAKTVFWLLDATVNGSWTAAGSGLPGTVLNGSGGAGATTFLDLTDTPSTFASQTLKLVRVNAGETALEFIAPTTFLANVVEDITPQLGGNLDRNGFEVTGLVIGTDVQAWDADLDEIAALAPSQGDIIYQNASAWALLSAGTSGQFLKTNGAGANPAWATVSGAMTEISDTTLASPQSQVDFTGLGSYKALFLQIIGLLGDATGTTSLRVSNDGGSSYLATGYVSAAFTSAGNDSLTTGLLLHRSEVGTNARHGQTMIFGWDTDIVTASGSSLGVTTVNANNHAGSTPASGPFDALRVLRSSGNLDTGTRLILHGIAA